MSATAKTLLADLRSRGIVVESRGDSIHVDAPAGVLNSEFLSQLRRRKQSLLMELNSQSSVDGELDRFFSTCVPDAAGHGWHGPDDDDSDAICTRRGFRIEPPQPGTPAGWTTGGWVLHLECMAAACEAMAPLKASEFRDEIKKLTTHVKESHNAET